MINENELADKKACLLRDWGENYNRYIEHATRSLKFKYALEHQKKRIAEALAFWKWVISKLQSQDAKVRSQILFEFMKSNNNLIALIAKIESMPTSLWRKVLLKYNIDFSSFESFLRRITVQQAKAVEENWGEFNVGKVPQVFSWWDRKIKKVTYKSLKMESLRVVVKDSKEYCTRYASKGSWSYNLLGLGFGFNAYPKGDADDTKVVEYSPLRFLSIKNHANDFVVNQEDGIYWWLYRTARSNYVWRRNRVVKLKDHICPGFWYTLAIHFLFWIISPIMAITYAVVAINGIQTYWWILVPWCLIGLFTPTWCIAALLIFSVRKIKKYIDETKAEGPKAVLATIIGCCIVVILAGMSGVLRYIYDLVLPYANPYLFCVLVSAYVCQGIYFHAENSRWHLSESYPLVIKAYAFFFFGYTFVGHMCNHWAEIIFAFEGMPEFIAWAWSVIVFLASFITKFIWTKLVYLIIMAWRLIASFIAVLILAKWAWLILIVPSLLVASVFYLDKLVSAEKAEKLWDFYIDNGAYLAWAMLAGLLVYAFFAGGMNMAITLMAICAFVCGVFFWVFASDFGLEKLGLRDSIEALGGKTYESRFARVSIGKIIKKNNWLRSLSDRDRKEKVAWVRTFSYAIDGLHEEFRNVFVVRVLSWISDEGQRRLSKNLSKISYWYLVLVCKDDRLIYRDDCFDDLISLCWKICNGASFEMAVAEVEKNRKKVTTQWEERKNNAIKVVKFIAWPFVTTYKLCKKLVVITVTLKRLYQLFNERCPYVEKSRTLHID